MASSSLARPLRELPQTAAPLAVGLAACLRRIRVATEEAAKNFGLRDPPRIVAASKQQPLGKIQCAYDQGLRHFGENYVQELQTKATELKKLRGYDGVRWHFIGHLQSNKTKTLLNIPNLWMVETVHSMKLARLLDRHWGLREGLDNTEPLRVLLQVNTSLERNKKGCLPEDLPELVGFITTDCPHLSFRGLMTVGKEGHTPDRHGNNPDYLALLQLCQRLESSLHTSLELSMGMSADFEHAIHLGSTSVRLGTVVFGPRPCNGEATS